MNATTVVFIITTDGKRSAILEAADITHAHTARVKVDTLPRLMLTLRALVERWIIHLPDRPAPAAQEASKLLDMLHGKSPQGDGKENES